MLTGTRGDIRWERRLPVDGDGQNDPEDILRLLEVVGRFDQASPPCLAGADRLHGPVDLGELKPVGDQLIEPQLAQPVELEIARDIEIRNRVAAMRADDTPPYVQWERVDRQTVGGIGNTTEDRCSRFLMGRVVSDLAYRVNPCRVDHGLEAETS